MEGLQVSAYPFFQSGLSPANMMVLLVVIKKFGKKIEYRSYKNLGNTLGMSYENVRYHFKILAAHGFLTIEKKSPRKLVFYIDVEKAKRLING